MRIRCDDTMMLDGSGPVFKEEERGEGGEEGEEG
jgi:hypothetical protein